MACYSVGLDLGQARDYTALAVVEHVRTRYDASWFDDGHWRQEARHLERIELGTPYPAIVERVAALMRSEPLRSDGRLYIDMTGVGRPIVDLFNAAARDGRMSEYPVGITITAEIKLDLVTGLEAALQTGRLRFASRDPLVDRLVAELKAFRVKLSATGHPTFEAERESDHDDMVIALALACHYRRRGRAGSEPRTDESAQLAPAPSLRSDRWDPDRWGEGR